MSVLIQVSSWYLQYRGYQAEVSIFVKGQSETGQIEPPHKS